MERVGQQNLDQAAVRPAAYVKKMRAERPDDGALTLGRR